MVIRNEIGFPRLQQLFLQTVHHICWNDSLLVGLRGLELVKAILLHVHLLRLLFVRLGRLIAILACSLFRTGSIVVSNVSGTNAALIPSWHTDTRAVSGGSLLSSMGRLPCLPAELFFWLRRFTCVHDCSSLILCHGTSLGCLSIYSEPTSCHICSPWYIRSLVSLLLLYGWLAISNADIDGLRTWRWHLLLSSIVSGRSRWLTAGGWMLRNLGPHPRVGSWWLCWVAGLCRDSECNCLVLLLLLHHLSFLLPFLEILVLI